MRKIAVIRHVLLLFFFKRNLKYIDYFLDGCENKLKQSLKNSDALVWAVWEEVEISKNTKA